MLDIMNVPEGEVFGPMVRVHDNFAEAAGLKVPSECLGSAALGERDRVGD